MSNLHDRQGFLGPNCIEVFNSTTIGIIGLCGGGSHIAQQLAHIGFKKFITCDCDFVEDPNLNRMVGSVPNDALINERKTTVIKRMVEAINPNANVVTVDGEWQSNQQQFLECSVIVGCVDKFCVRDELEKFCRRFLIPYIDIGMDVHNIGGGYFISGQTMVSIPDDPCMWCCGIITDERISEEQKRYGDVGGRPQVIWPNGVLASEGIGQLMSLLLPWNENVKPVLLLEYDGNRHTVRPSNKIKILEGRKCPHFNSSHSLGDPFFTSQILKIENELASI